MMMRRLRNAWCAGGSLAALVLLGTAPACSAQELPRLEAGRLLDGTIEAEGRKVVVLLPLTEGQSIQVDAIPGAGSSAGPSLDLAVFGPDNAGVIENNDYNSQRFTVFSETGGLYRVEVTSSYGTGPFTLLARESLYRPPQIDELDLSSGRVEKDVEFADPGQGLFSFSGTAGSIYVISLTGAKTDIQENIADPYLELYEGGDLSTYPLFSNDDSAGQLDSRIVADLPNSATYTIKAASLSSAGKGKLVVERLVVKPAPLEDLAPGAHPPVTFGPESPLIVDGSLNRLSPYAQFRLVSVPAPDALVAAGEVLVLRALSEQLIPWLDVGYDTPTGFVSIASGESTFADDATEVQLRLDPAPYATGKAGADGARWWSSLRVRLAVPAGSAGNVSVFLARRQAVERPAAR